MLDQWPDIFSVNSGAETNGFQPKKVMTFNESFLEFQVKQMA